MDARSGVEYLADLTRDHGIFKETLVKILKEVENFEYIPGRAGLPPELRTIRNLARAAMKAATT